MAIQLLRRAGKANPNEPAADGSFKLLRQTVELIFDTLKGLPDLEHHQGGDFR